MTTKNNFIRSTLVCGSLIATIHASEPILYFAAEEDSGSIFDQIANLPASPVDAGHGFMSPRQDGFGGNAVTLNDNGSWQLSAADSAVLRNLTNDFTVAAWLYLDQATLDAKATAGGLSSFLNRFIGDDVAWDGDGWAMGIFNTGQVRFTKNGIVDVDVGAAGEFPIGEWAHFAATVSSTDGITLYVNGVEVGNNPDTSDIITTQGNNGSDDVYAIGRAYGNGEAQWFGGRIDEVRVFDCVLNLAEVQALLVPLRDPALVTENSINLNANGAPTTIDIPITNDGEAQTLQITGASFSGANAADFGVVTATPFEVDAQMNGTFQINFTPSNGVGNYEATLNLQTNDPQRPSFDIALTSTVRDPWLVIEGGTDFGTLTSNPGPTSTMIMIRNNGGTQTLTFEDPPESTGVNGALFTVNSFPDSLAPGEAGNIEVTFNPGAREGRLRGILQIVSDDPVDDLLSVDLDSRVSFANLNSHLISRFGFDDPDAPGTDSGNAGNDATLMGDAAFVGDARIGNGALTLDGGGDYLEVGGASDYNTLLDDGEGFTVTAWVCPTADVDSVNQRIASTSSGWELGYTRTQISRLFGNASDVNNYLQPGVPAGPVADKWSHLAYVFSGAPTNSVEFFVDGVSIGSTAANTAGLNPGGGLFIGSFDEASGFFFGKLDDVRIYDAELTAANIMTVINATGVVPAPPNITGITLNEDSVNLTWVSRPNATYTVERSFSNPDLDVLGLRDWEKLDDEVDSEGVSTSFTDSSLPDGVGQIFYRVIENAAGN